MATSKCMEYLWTIRIRATALSQNGCPCGFASAQKADRQEGTLLPTIVNVLNRECRLSSRLVSLALLVSASVAYAASPAVPAKSVDAYSTGPFNTEIDSLPPKFRGHDLFEVYQKIKPPKNKGEFETTVEYESRVARWRSLPFLGKLTPEDTLAFVIFPQLSPDAVKTDYDADQSLLKVSVNFENHYVADGSERWLETYFTSKNLGARPAVTRMGVKFRVTYHTLDSFGLAVDDKYQNMVFSLPTERQQALELKVYLRVLAVVELVTPYRVKFFGGTTASLTDPDDWSNNYFGLKVKLKELWLYNSKTGEVLVKSITFKKCDDGYCS